MTTFSRLFKTLFGSAQNQAANLENDSEQQLNTLTLARFEGVVNAFEQLQTQLPDAWSDPKIVTHSRSQRAMVFYALASARMQLAEQLQVAFLNDLKNKTLKASQARLDLQKLTSQIETLTRAAVSELMQPECTRGEWEVKHGLLAAINPDEEISEQAEDTIAHLQAVYNGGLILFTSLQTQLEKRLSTQPVEAEQEGALLSKARLLLAEAQHIFNTLKPLASQLQFNPSVFAVRDSLMHEELENKIVQMVRLLEGAAAELTLPNITTTALWNNLVTDLPGSTTPPTRTLSENSSFNKRSPSNDKLLRPWESDRWCMTSELFKKDYFREARANKVLKEMWRGDPHPATTWSLYQSVVKLEQNGSVRRTGSYYNACPWTNIWRATKTVRVGNQTVKVGEEFCLHVETEADGEFVRKVIVADFQPTEEIDYCEDD